MKTSTTLKRLICRVLIGVFAYTQLAVAAYACAGLLGTAAPSMSQTGSTLSVVAGNCPGMSETTAEVSRNCTDEMNAQQVNLCSSHCQYGQQHADSKPAPAMPAALMTGFYTYAALHPYPVRVSVAVGLRSTPLVVDPPHAILHCCLRT